MLLNGIKIGFAITGCFQMLKISIDIIKELLEEGAEITPILSYSTYTTDTKYGKASDFCMQVETLTGNKIIHTIAEAENIRYKKMIDILIIVPCSSNTIAKIVHGISDTSVSTAVKCSLTNNVSTIIGVCAKDGLSSGSENIGKLLNTKNIYFIPFGQPNPITKPNYICFNQSYITETIVKAMDKEQIQPLLI